MEVRRLADGQEPVARTRTGGSASGGQNATGGSGGTSAQTGEHPPRALELHRAAVRRMVAGGGQNGGAGAGGAATGGASGAGGGPGGECTRALLDGLLDDYFAALSAGDPSSLPLAANVKFTENAEVTEIGTTDFWMNAGETKYSQRALDTEACSVAARR